MSAIERLNFDRSFFRAPNHPSGMGDAVRFCIPSHIGEGYEDGFATTDNCLLTTKQIRVSDDFQETEPGLGRLVFLYHLSGNRVVDVPGMSQHTLNVPCFVAYYHPEGISKVNLWSRGGWDTGVTIGFDFDDPPPIVASSLPDIIRIVHLSFEGDPEFVWFQSPLTPEMANVTESLLFPNIHHRLLREYLSTKSRELLLLGMDSILNDQKIRSESPDAITQKIKAAKQFLDENTRNNINLELLAEDLGIESTTLSEHFAQRYNRTIHKYAAESRMAKAVHLLVSTTMPIKQIAYEVGYNHVSNFSIAFKRRFNETARRVRLEGNGVKLN